MKLIIDIPKEAQADIVKIRFLIGGKEDRILQQKIINAIKNGIPLDDVIVQIKQGYCRINNDYDQGRNYGLYIATQILDNIGKAESEE